MAKKDVGFLGCGDVFFNLILSGVRQGFLPLGNSTKFEIKANAELKERTSKSCSNHGATIDSVAIPSPAQLSITLDSLDADNMSLAFLGSVEDRTTAAGTVTDEPHQVKTLGAMMRLLQPNISDVVVKSADGLTTYTEDTDYVIVNAKVALVEIVKTGSIVTSGVAAPVIVSYTHGEVKARVVKGSVRSEVKMELMLVGKNLSDASEVEVNVWEAVVTPQSGVDWLADDFTSIDLAATLNLDAVKGNPFEVQTEKTFA